LAAFTLNKRLLETAGSRDLQIDGTVRGVSANVTSHGARPHRHERVAYDFLGINVVLRGRGVYIDATGKSFDLVPGTLFHRFPGVTHTTRFDAASDYTEFHIVFDGITGRQLLQLGLVPDNAVIDVGVDPLVLDEYRHFLKRIRLHEVDLPSRDLLVDAIAFITGLYRRQRDLRALGFWERVIRDGRLMLEHNQDERMRMEDVAAHLGVSYAAFRKNFTKATGVSPNDYRIRKRLESAKFSLAGDSIKQVARSLGYCDSFAFSSQFKRHFGISPREFQRQVRK
jgi:AraC-like DNA-binding protein